MKRIQFCLLPLLLLLFTAVSLSPAHAAIIDTATESLSQARVKEVDSTCASLTSVTSPKRAGSYAFRHFVDNCGKRSELAMKTTAIGATNWYGWSVYIPTSFNPAGQSTIINQMAAWPSPRDGNFACDGVGHKMSIGLTGEITYYVQYAGATEDSACTPVYIGHVEAWKGQWVDIVMQAKWTGNRDGFLKLWTKKGASGSYEQKINYTGATWWNDEDLGPYFKMGIYTGIYNWTGQDKIIYTDEYRMGDASSSFDEVKPK